MKNIDTLSAAQKIGLKYFQEVEKRIPQNEIKEIEKKIRGVVEGVDSEYIMTVCGSYRRGVVSSEDMDILLTHPSFVERRSIRRMEDCCTGWWQLWRRRGSSPTPSATGRPSSWECAR